MALCLKPLPLDASAPGVSKWAPEGKEFFEVCFEYVCSMNIMKPIRGNK